MVMAERFASSQFLGIDFAANEIASAQALAKEVGLKNVAFEQADLLNWDPDGEQYDYIIAYGLFSWVPDEVKERLFQVCRECLSPRGIACISYMTYPGCKQPESLRDLLQLRTEQCSSSEEKVAAAHRVLDFLDRAYGNLPSVPHSSYLRDEVQKIRQKEPHFLLLDELGVERDPCYLLQFVSWAAEHDLYYLGESELHMMFLENLPPESARELSAMNLDRLQTEQLIDYVVNRSFRCSLLASSDTGREPHLDALAMRKLCLKPRFKPAGRAREEYSEAQFASRFSGEVTLRGVPLVTFCLTLASFPDSFTEFSILLKSAETLAGKKFQNDEVARLCEDLLSLLVRKQVEVSAVSYAPPKSLPVKPCLTPLNRTLAQRHAMVATSNHTACKLGSYEKSLCALMNGTRTLAEIREVSGHWHGTKPIEQTLEVLRISGALEDA
ncbi:class I SAM-dependent methyltransferase [Aeoliella sp. ICT_H6.2]|uniref:Class I SAM-dependent methyltransferase n=1 Tax=Aeoliella straminimaris TaxID=2954799 RepID=A0A9X2FDM7_9BACT|nr:class I SAM-dependent methyltransferase [Aeoliella straminimaris]